MWHSTYVTHANEDGGRNIKLKEPEDGRGKITIMMTFSLLYL